MSLHKHFSRNDSQTFNTDTKLLQIMDAFLRSNILSDFFADNMRVLLTETRIKTNLQILNHTPKMIV